MTQNSILRLAWVVLAGAPLFAQQQPLQLSLTQAYGLAIQNNPQFSAAKLNASAALEVPKEYHANYLPNLAGNITGVGADSGSRIAAGALNNPAVYSRVASGLVVSQMVAD